MPIATFLVVACFAAVHLFAGKLRSISMIPRSRLLSAAGGISVAYVFLHILPELAQGQEHVEEALPGTVAFLQHHVYVVALLGLGLFYGLERAVKSRRPLEPEGGRQAGSPDSTFWLHIVSFAGYNLLIGYLTLHREQPDVVGLLLWLVAIGLHFFTNDFGLREDHRAIYDRFGRWILAAAVLIGWLVGLAVELPRATLAIPFAFLAGGVILNVMKEELPEERQSRFGAFALGALAYGAVLIGLA